MGGRRNIVAGGLPDRGDRFQDDVELAGQAVQFRRCQIDPGQRREVGDLLARDGRHARLLACG